MNDTRAEKQRQYVMERFNLATVEAKSAQPYPPDTAAIVLFLHTIAAALIYVGDAIREAREEA